MSSLFPILDRVFQELALKLASTLDQLAQQLQGEAQD